ncbi:MAG: TonB-dependent receptor [Chitinophagaceae bacterium]|nr:MAG: TonB-dependent receptor [Chitinophagaceae bacterium]
MIKGTVLTSDGKPAADVTVQIKNVNKGTVTDANGQFLFRRMKPGTYTLQVSYVDHESIEQEVVVLEDQIAVIKINLTTSDKELQEVVVSAGRNRYKTNNASNSLRIKTPLIEVPQNIQVVSSQILADQQVFDVVDGITRNVSGVSRVGHWDNQYAQIRMRGSKIPAFRNGMNIEASWGPTAEDASMIDRIEFVKGPAGFMLAAGEPGGFYNVVTKKPTGQTKGSATLSMGSFSTYRAALDFDGLLSKNGKLLYRLNLSGQQKDFFTKYNYSNKYVVAPSLKYLVDENTSLTLEYTFQGSKYLNNGNYTFSPKGFADKDIRNDFFYGDPSFAPGQLRDHNVYLYFDHKINERWDMHAQVAYFNFNMKANSTWANYLTENGDMSRYFSIGDEAGENRFGQFSFSGEESTWGIKHRILAGADFGNKKFWGDFRTLKDSVKFAGTTKFNVYNPVYGIPMDSLPLIVRNQDIRTRAGSTTYATVVSYASAYVQDELGFFNNKLRLSLGLRFTYAETVGKTNAASIRDQVFSPRAGLSFSVADDLTVYGLYDQSFVPVPGTDWQGNAFNPIRGNDLEAGIKKEWFNGKWVSSVSAYTITRQNALVTDPDPDHVVGGRTFQAQLGETKTKGIEVDLGGEIFRGLNITANYAYTDSKISKATDKTTIGNVTPNTARHITNAWLQYRIPSGAFEGFGASVGVQSQTGRHIASTQVPNFPDYFRADGGISFQKGKYSISMLVNNLLNNQRILTAGSTTNANAAIPGSVRYYTYIVEARRNFRMSIAYRF